MSLTARGTQFAQRQDGGGGSADVDLEGFLYAPRQPTMALRLGNIPSILPPHIVPCSTNAMAYTTFREEIFGQNPPNCQYQIDTHGRKRYAISKITVNKFV